MMFLGDHLSHFYISMFINDLNFQCSLQAFEYILMKQ